MNLSWNQRRQEIIKGAELSSACTRGEWKGGAFANAPGIIIKHQLIMIKMGLGERLWPPG